MSCIRNVTLINYELCTFQLDNAYKRRADLTRRKISISVCTSSLILDEFKSNNNFVWKESK